MSAVARTEIGQDDLERQVARSIDRAIARNIPGLALAQSDADLDVGPSPKELVYQHETARVWHYLPSQNEIYRVPVLIVMSPVAKGYILDLTRGQSLIEYLTLQGHDVYMLDWVGPRRDQSHLGLADYVYDLVGGAVTAVSEDAGEPDLTLVGYCMGGMLACMYTAVVADNPVKNLACFTTPVNADGMELYKRWMTAKSFDIDRLVAELGNIPGDFINQSLQALRPLQRSANHMRLLNNVGDDAFVKAHLRFDRWAVDQLPVAGELARDLVHGFIIGNRFARNELVLRGRTVDLRNITVPFLHVAAQHDHIVPAAASRELLELVGSQDKQEIVMKGGHVSLVAGGNAMFRLWPQLDEWLTARAL